MAHRQMKLIVRKLDTAQCGAVLEGSDQVFIEDQDGAGRGIAAVGDTGTDSEGTGEIEGPGCVSVFFGSDVKIPSLVDDTFTGHNIGSNGHPTNVTTTLQTTVFAPTQYDGEGGFENIDLISWMLDDEVIFYTSGLSYYPPGTMNHWYFSWWFCCTHQHESWMCSWTNRPAWSPLFLTENSLSNQKIRYAVQNTPPPEGFAHDPAGQFTVGLYKVPWSTGGIINEMISDEAYPAGVELLAEQTIPGLEVGEIYEGAFDLGTINGSLPMGSFRVQVYPDIYRDITEPDESNAPPTTTRVVIDNGCGLHEHNPGYLPGNYEMSHFEIEASAMGADYFGGGLLPDTSL